MYIDRHELLGITAEELAAAHYSDLAAQPEYGVQYHTYWFDPESGCVFCLAEGPNQEAVEAVHRNSHGQVATSVIEIEQGAPLRRLLRRVADLSARDRLPGARYARHPVHRCVRLRRADASAR